MDVRGVVSWMSLLAVLGAACGPQPVAPPPGATAINVQFQDAVLRYPLGGLEVCAADRPDVPCAKTGADGRVSAPLPPNAEIMLRCRAPLHATTSMTLFTPDADFDVGVFRLLEQATADLFTGIAGAPRNPDRGILLVNLYDEMVKRDVRVADATVTLEPSAGVGPLYGGNGVLPDSRLTSTSVNGPAGFYDLPPGDYSVTITHPSRSCTGGFGWPGASPTTLRTRVFAGGMSTVTYVCPP
jgi:hypothetical protein